MAAIVHIHPNGRPEIRIRHTVHGVLRRKSIKDPAILTSIERAHELAAILTRKLERGEYVWDAPISADTPTPAWPFRRYGAHWLAEHTSLKPATLKFYRLNLQILDPLVGAIPIGELTRARCKAAVLALVGLRGARTKQPLSMKTREGIWRTLSTVLTGALDDNLIEANPAVRLGKYLGPDRRRLKQAITPYTFEESTRFLARAKRLAPDYYELFYIWFRTGLREGELIELRWDQDFPAHRPNQIHVQRSFSGPAAVADLAGGIPRDEAGVTTPKTGRDRYVDCSPGVLAALKRLKTAQLERAFAQGRGIPGLCVTGPRGGRVQTGNLLRRIVRRICLTKLPDLKPLRVITLHAIRHTYVTQMLLRHGRGVLPYVSQQIGHRDPATTERYYAHWLFDQREALAARLDDPDVPDLAAGLEGEAE